MDYKEWVAYIEFKDGGYKNRHYKTLKKLIKKYGKSNAEIVEEIKDFCFNAEGWKVDPPVFHHKIEEARKEGIEFYAYYADYDWVAFCWLFGLMIDLPKGFPMYCRDLKQMLDSKAVNGLIPYTNDGKVFTWTLANIENFPDYPKQEDEHNALADARWGFEFFKFLEKL